MTDADIGWLAGIIDGEGCIHLYRHRQGVGYSPGLTLGSTSRKMLEKFVRLLGELGAASYYGPTRCHPTSMVKKPFYQVRLCKRAELMTLLRLVVPHLTEKQAFCQAVLDFYADHRPYSHWTDDEVEKLREIRQEFQPKRTTV